MSQSIIWILVVVGIGILGAIIFLLNAEKAKSNSTTQEKEEKPKSFEAKTTGLIDYNVYQMGKKENKIYISIAAVAIFIIGYIFYKSIIMSALIMPFALMYPSIRTKEIIKKRKDQLNYQFKDALYSLSSSLSAGKSIEMAFKDALKDLEILYPDPDSFILKEFQYIIRKLDMNETAEAALQDFATRSHLEDIQNFVDVFQTCKRTGGNLVQVIKNSSDIINDKITIKQEIDTMLSQRKLEQRILNVLPIGMIFMLSASAEDFMKPIFTQVAGRAVMTVAIVLLVTAYFISKKIMEIEV